MSDETARIIDQEVKALIERNYARTRQLLEDNMDIMHAMKDALMKYETIDAPQVDDLMARREVRPPAGWEEEQNNRSDNGGAPQAPVNKPAEEQLNTPSSDDNITTGNTGEK